MNLYATPIRISATVTTTTVPYVFPFTALCNINNRKILKRDTAMDSITEHSLIRPRLYPVFIRTSAVTIATIKNRTFKISGFIIISYLNSTLSIEESPTIDILDTDSDGINKWAVFPRFPSNFKVPFKLYIKHSDSL